MLSIWIIALFVIVFMRDALGTHLEPAAPQPSGLFLEILGPTSPWVWIFGLLPYLAIAAIVHLVITAAGREMDRRGSLRALVVADRTLATSRVLVVFIHLGNVMLLGWLTSARALVGDVIVLDELMCIAPALLVFVAGWCSAYAIDRRVREATMFRALESGRPVHPVPTRGQFVLTSARNMLALPLAPLVFLAAWSEIGERLFARLARHAAEPGWFGQLARWAQGGGGENLQYLRLGLQLVGVAIVMALAPLIVRVLWDTVRMSAGAMRDRLDQMCRVSRVRVRDILVWKTHGAMTNGAVVGLTGRLRYVLLTDALLESMAPRQVEAVMAHEIAHARHAHIPWLAVVFISAFGCIGALAGGLWQGVLDLAGIGIDPETIARSARAAAAEAPDTFSTLIVILGDSIVTMGSLVGGVLVLGFASRRFEWQADAFAAKSLSELPALPSPAPWSSRSVPPSPPGPVALAHGHDPAFNRPAQSREHGAATTTGGPSDADAQLPLFPASSLAVSERIESSGVAAPVAADDAAPADGPTSVMAACISGPESGALETADGESSGMVRRAAVDAMAEALQTVAALNYIPRHRASFRHGSIAQRQRKLRELVGLPLDRLPIDRSVRWIKRAAAMGLCALIALALLGF